MILFVKDKSKHVAQRALFCDVGHGLPCPGELARPTGILTSGSPSGVQDFRGPAGSAFCLLSRKVRSGAKPRLGEFRSPKPGTLSTE